MNAPGRTLTYNPEIEWSKLLCVSFARLFAPLLFLWCVRLIMKNAKSSQLSWAVSSASRKLHHAAKELHRRTGRGREGGCSPPPPPPPNLRQLRFFGQEEKFGQNQFLKKFPCFFIISKREIFYFNLKPAWYKIQLNRPFPSSPGPLYQNDVRCSTFDMEMIFHCHVNNKTHFHEKGWAPNLVLIQRPWGTRKWPINTRQWLPGTWWVSGY